MHTRPNRLARQLTALLFPSTGNAASLAPRRRRRIRGSRVTPRPLAARPVLLRPALLLPVLLFAWEDDASAIQEESNAAEVLAEIETLAATGRTAQARDQLEIWWETERLNATSRVVERALWLRGRLQTKPEEAARDFRRLLAEYPSGPYADLALLRLVQGSRASGDAEGEREYLESLARAYPGSPGHQASVAWSRGEEVRLDVGLGVLAELDAPPPSPPNPPSPLGPSDAASTGEPSPDEHPAAHAVREEPDTLESAVVEEPDTLESAVANQTPELVYSVQLGAFRDLSRAERLFERAVERGIEARVVRLPESQLHYVRVGRFGVQADADALQARLTELGFRTFVVRDAHEEEPAR